MSTEDVPGHKPENRDKLAAACWAEHKDGSMIFVLGTEGGRVVFSIFDMSKEPAIEWKDSMAEGAFKREFSWSPEKTRGKDDAWTWHDKTPFPWDRFIRAGGRDGGRYADVEDQLSEAERIRRRRSSLYGEDNAAERARRRRELNEAQPVDLHEIETRIERVMGKGAQAIVDAIQKALGKLPPARGKQR